MERDSLDEIGQKSSFNSLQSFIQWSMCLIFRSPYPYSMLHCHSSLNSPFIIYFAGLVIRDEMGLTLDKAGKEVLGTAIKVVITKDSTLIVTDGSTRAAVEKRISEIRSLAEVVLLVSFYIVLVHFALRI